ncbi:MAG: helix-turn-helix transcriptional regulator, partial [Chloroflexi bacterium]|nr:helix-turn-helix transcriptional regulator [Chloroflexota bacterium]
MPLQTNSSRQRRLALGWSIEELAQRSGIPMHLLTRYEQGQYLPPAQRSKLARVYGCSTEDIPERDPWVVDTDTATTDISSLWERVIGQYLRQSVELSAVLRPGELVRGYLAVGDPTALVVQTERDWYLVPVPRVH